MVVLVFSFWGNPHCLHSGCTDIHFDQHLTRVSFSLHPPQHFLLVVFLTTATWQVWGSTSLWSWFSNPWGDVEHLFICLLAIRISSLQKCLFSALPHFKIGFWVFFPIHSMSPLAILDIYHEQYERQNDRILKEELLRSVGAQYATGDQWRNNSRKNEGMH